MLPGLGSTVLLPAGMERGFAGLLPLRAQSPDSHKGRMWGKFAQRILEVLRGKGESPEQIPAAVHSLHTHPVTSIFPGRWQTTWPLPKNAQVSPSPGFCRGDPTELGAPSAPDGASPAAAP